MIDITKVQHFKGHESITKLLANNVKQQAVNKSLQAENTLLRDLLIGAVVIAAVAVLIDVYISSIEMKNESLAKKMILSYEENPNDNKV